jgi:hypothetical protein
MMEAACCPRILARPDGITSEDSNHNYGENLKPDVAEFEAENGYTAKGTAVY